MTNPIWTVQTAQSTRAVTVHADGSGDLRKVKPSGIEAAREIIRKDGVKGLWRGIGPALILVINPVIQASKKDESWLNDDDTTSTQPSSDSSPHSYRGGLPGPG